MGPSPAELDRDTVDGRARSRSADTARKAVAIPGQSFAAHRAAGSTESGRGQSRSPFSLLTEGGLEDCASTLRCSIQEGGAHPRNASGASGGATLSTRRLACGVSTAGPMIAPPARGSDLDDSCLSGTDFGRGPGGSLRRKLARKRALKARLLTISRASGPDPGCGADCRGSSAIRRIASGPRTSAARPKSGQNNQGGVTRQANLFRRRLDHHFRCALRSACPDSPGAIGPPESTVSCRATQITGSRHNMCQKKKSRHWTEPLQSAQHAATELTRGSIRLAWLVATNGAQRKVGFGLDLRW